MKSQTTTPIYAIQWSGQIYFRLENGTLLTQRVQYRRPDSTRSASVRSTCVRREDPLRYDMMMQRCSLSTIFEP